MLTLLIAAMGRQKKGQCKDYVITVNKAESGDLFLNEAAIAKLLKATVNGNIKGQSKSSFNLQKMEQLLEDNAWVKDAQLYFDNKNVLHVSVVERRPVARVFTTGSRSFYIDENGLMMPLSDRVSAKVPVFTGFSDKKKLGTSDSLLLTDVQTTAQFIASDPFWMAQVAQIDIVACGPHCWDFEMVPLVGNHIVRLGNGGDMKKKFERLMVFYEQVISKTGFDKYRTIDVQYEGQVVAAKSAGPKVDSIQFRRNVLQMLKEAREMQQLDGSVDNRMAVKEDVEPRVTPLQVDDGSSVETDSKKNSDKEKNESKKVEDRKKPEKNKPKAVMPKKTAAR